MEENRSKFLRRRMVTMRHDLPWDIMINILSRLPVKSLMRFRCVCKSWHSLFSSLNFIDTHLNQTRANIDGYVFIQLGFENFSLHCDETFVEHTRLEPPFSSPSESFMVEGYRNGLLCLSGTKGYKSNIHLWNPAIQKFKTLPESLLRCDTIGPLFLIFYFLPHINDYRVLKFHYDHGGTFPDGRYHFKVPPNTEIYSLMNNSWKVIQDVAPCEIVSSSMDPIVNGVGHWVARKPTEDNPYYEFILSFDMDNEVFGEIELPWCCHDVSVLDKALTMLKESLSLFVQFKEGGKERVDIWVMKEYGVAKSWTKQFTFDGRVDFLCPLGFMKNGEIVLKTDQGEPVLYDPRVQQAKGLQIYGSSSSVGKYIYLLHGEPGFT